ncbi:hypothetical protein CIG75_08945 [Tumebacillus algifaecis]|uniref:Uncharacterized protein n=1 Tax=Tumebacillus algifaecis TaxID=1214604 RepID=A0A223D0F7_9BACL|nr:hypothetical protein [Tumebacillus algifaecis]ASS75090.1 hypothetical protein CIG75_08945 [Tumebacillus algifaecis]
MSYYRFWWRTCLIFCPTVFLILYLSGVSLLYSLLSGLGVAVIGLLLILPFIFIFSRVDRSMWSPEEEIKRKLRYQQKLREWEGQDDEEEEERER